MKLRVLDTFAGAGGFSLGFALAGCDIVGAVEIDEWAAETFAANHRHAKVLTGDIETMSDDYLKTEFLGREPDIVLGGPPCQGFSICTKNAGDPRDPRNSLFKEFIRVGKLFSPSIMVMENVPNLVNARTDERQSVIKIIEDELTELGYHVYWKILEATHYGIPQIRRRLFVIASKSEFTRPFPSSTHAFCESEQAELIYSSLKKCPTLWDAISDLPELKASEGKEVSNYSTKPLNHYQAFLREGSDKLYNHVAMRHSKRMVERFAAMSWGESVSDVPPHLRPYVRNGAGKISDRVYDQNNRRMYPYRPCHTIPASFYANFVHPFSHRNFTAREGARIQSFTDTYVFKGKPTVVSHKLLQREGRLTEKHLCQYNQIGNAVPPLLAKALAENIIKQVREA